MAIKIQGTDVISDARQLQNIASLDSTTANTISEASGSTIFNRYSIYTASGSFTVPTGITKMSIMTVGGGGGAGGANVTLVPGGDSFDAEFLYGAPGGNGGISSGIKTVVPADTLTITVGGGGAGGSGSNNGSTGGTSSVTGTGMSISSTGGAGGLSRQNGGTPSTNTAHGTGSGGDFSGNSSDITASLLTLKTAVYNNPYMFFDIGPFGIYAVVSAQVNNTNAQTWALRNGRVPGTRGVFRTCGTFGLGGGAGMVLIAY